MHVVKRNGRIQNMSFDKIIQRVQILSRSPEPVLQVNASRLVISVVDKLLSGITTTQIDELTARECASRASSSSDLGVLAGRIVVSSNHKNTQDSFVDVTHRLYVGQATDSEPRAQVSKEYYDVANKHGVSIQEMLDFSRDYNIDYFGFKTLERAYLLSIDGTTVERPQHMWMPCGARNTWR